MISTCVYDLFIDIMYIIELNETLCDWHGVQIYLENFNNS